MVAAGWALATVMRSRRRRAQGGQPGPGGPSGARAHAVALDLSARWSAAPSRTSRPVRARGGGAQRHPSTRRQELAFAQLQYGSEQTRPFQAGARAGQGARAPSFELQQKLEDHIPDSEADQRARLGRSSSARGRPALPGQQEQNFAQAAPVETRAPEALERVRSAVAATAPRLRDVEAQLVSLHWRDDDAARVRPRQRRAGGGRRLRVATAQASSTWTRGRSPRRRRHPRGGGGAGAGRPGLLDSVDNARRELARAEESLKDAVSIAQRDVAEAEGLVRAGLPPRARGAAAACAPCWRRSRSRWPRPLRPIWLHPPARAGEGGAGQGTAGRPLLRTTAPAPHGRRSPTPGQRPGQPDHRVRLRVGAPRSGARARTELAGRAPPRTPPTSCRTPTLNAPSTRPTSPSVGHAAQRAAQQDVDQLHLPHWATAAPGYGGVGHGAPQQRHGRCDARGSCWAAPERRRRLRRRLSARWWFRRRRRLRWWEAAASTAGWAATSDPPGPAAPHRFQLQSSDEKRIRP
ncbi:hypothetical protein QJS66_22565 [Kocuria rhizophila]|nr:hypothetical protein QJS66_22565 [Kocuria rhizophila]